MAEFTLRENADRFLIGEITYEQLYDHMDAVIIREMRSATRHPEESSLAGFLCGLHYDYKAFEKATGYFEEDELRQELAAHFYMQQLGTAQSEETAKAAAAAS